MIRGGLIGSPLGGINIPDSFHDAENTLSTAISSSASSDVFEEFVSLTTGFIPTGRYRIGWHVVFSYDDDKTPVMIRVQLNHTNLVTPLIQLIPHDRKINQQLHQSGFACTDLTSGTHVVDLSFSRDDASKLLIAHEGRIEIWRISI